MRKENQFMDKMVVLVFGDEKRAYEGIKALKELHDENAITLYATAVIERDAHGEVIVKESADQGPIGTAVGLLTGSLIGLLGGPVALAAGAVAGAMGGVVYDAAQLGIGVDFLDEVSQKLTPGKMAVVAEIDEEWVTPLDTRIEALGGIVYRQARWDFVAAQTDLEIAAAKAEFIKLKAEYRHATGEAKAKLKAKVDAAQHKLEAKRNLIHQKIEDMKHEAEAKIKSMQEQAVKTTAETKAKLEKRIDETRADYKHRADKLRQAWQLIKEAAA
jgi:uncharacterized membrane protein